MKNYSTLFDLLHYRVLRPARANAWGPQIGIGLLFVWLGLNIGRRGQPHELRVTWPYRGEPLLHLRWAGWDVQPRWGMRYGDLWLWRVCVRVLSPYYAAASLLRLLTHGRA